MFEYVSAANYFGEILEVCEIPFSYLKLRSGLGTRSQAGRLPHFASGFSRPYSWALARYQLTPGTEVRSKIILSIARPLFRLFSNFPSE
jgi:hypothetical protein